MRRTVGRPWLLVGLALLGATACSDDLTVPEAAAPDTGGPVLAKGTGNPRSAIPGQYVVVLRPGAPNVAKLAAEAASAPGDSVLFVYRHALQGFAARLSPASLHGLTRHPMVERITQDELGVMDQEATWSLDRVDQRLLPLDSVYAPPRDGTGVNVYVFDTGIRKSHREFGWGARARHGYTAIHDGFGSEDCNGHGTHVAATAAGSTYGVAKGATVHAVRIADCAGNAPVSGLIGALDWLVANHLRPAVANLSFSWSGRSDIDDAVQRAINAGITVVTSAGNSNVDACTYSPNRKSNVVTVAGSTSSDWRYTSSNWGTCVKMFAPGTSILSAWSGSDTDVRYATGTSMSSPQVAGIAALYLQGDPYAAAWKVQDAVQGSATRGMVQDTKGSPNLLLYAFPVYLGVSIEGPFSVTSSGEHTWEAATEGGSGSYTYQWQVRWSHGYTETLGTGRTQSLYLFMGDGDFEMTVTVSSAGQTKSASTYVSNMGSGGGCELRFGECWL